MKERYENLDGIRAFAAIGIILMHVKANGRFPISGFMYDSVISSFTNLTFFFMLLSAFSMCCGYYEKFKSSTISLEKFYKRRFERVWPFFAFLCTLELAAERSLTALFEWFADLTLAFGLLPNANISVVGVGWFLGLIFVFYMVFPFYTFLLGNKKRGWFVLGITIVMNVLCRKYFLNETHVVDGFGARTNILYSSMFFVAGGLIYLYREAIKKVVTRYKVFFIITTIVCIAFYYCVNGSEYTMVVLFTLITALGISGGNITKALFQNKGIRILSSVSMEIYLCHMFVFRIIEKLGFLHVTGIAVIDYAAVCAATIGGAAVVSLLFDKLLWLAENRLQKLKTEHG